MEASVLMGGNEEFQLYSREGASTPYGVVLQEGCIPKKPARFTDVLLEIFLGFLRW